MRPLEWLLCVCMLPLIFLMFSGRQLPRAAWGFLLVTVLLLHAIFEGVHWQLAPAYIAAIALAMYASALFYLSRWMAVSVAGGCVALMLAAGVFSYLSPMFKLPAPTGKYRIGTQIIHVIDPTRPEDGDSSTRNSSSQTGSQKGSRQLVAQAWYPARAGWQRLAAYRRLRETNLKSSYQSVLKTHAYRNAPVETLGAPFPLLIFSPAWTGQRTQSTFLMEDLASHGFVVVSVDHTYYSGRVEFPDGQVFEASRAPDIGNFEGSTLEEQNARGDKYTLIEAQDQIAVLNAMAAMNEQSGSPFYRALDLERVGALGHSIGGAAAAQSCFMDPRIKAALNMDGWIFADVFHHGLAKPFMRIIGSPEIRPSPQELASSPALRMYWQRNDEDEAQITALLHHSAAYGLAINGLNHASFTDRPLYSPLARWGNQQEVPAARAYRIIDAYVLAFFSHYLRGSEEPLLDQNPSPFPEVQTHFPK